MKELLILTVLMFLATASGAATGHFIIHQYF